ncbi:MAG: lipopolysaccharide biosynthesis protein RfbH [Bacteroidota bacterium]|jgi:CDP-6-deoxy-D-xylo-4-hexulose-3-dehydrase
MNKKEEILNLITLYIEEKNKNAKWTPGEDWIQYSGPYFDSKEYTAAIDSLLNGWLILGEKGREFEKKFSKFLGKNDGILVNSGSSANLLMVSLLKTKRGGKLPKGSKFITPVVCFPTTINPLIQCGFEPVFVDVTLPSLNLDLDQVERLLENDVNKEIKGLIFAHVLGNPPDMDRILEIVKKYNLIFLEDSCDALGSTWDNKPLGSFGDVSTCSFFPAHHMTMGEGGFVAVNNARYRMALASLRDWGRACYCNSAKPGNIIGGTACGNRLSNWFKGQDNIIYDHRFVFEEIGFNLKPTEMQAAMGLVQLDKLDEMHSKRKSNFKRMYDIFKKYEQWVYLPEALPQADPSWFGFLITLKDNCIFEKNDLVEHLENAKIQTRSYFTGNALFHPAYEELAANYENPKEQFPIATKSSKDTFFMGVYPGLTEEQLDYIETVVDKFFQNLK